MGKIFTFLERKLPSNYFLQICIFFLLTFVFSILVNVIVNDISGGFILEVTEERRKENIILLLFNLVTFAPLFETFISQWMPIFIYMSFRKDSKYDIVVLVLLSVLFGLAHGFNWGYKISSMLVGFLYVTITLYYATRSKNYFIPVYIIHLFNNGLAMIKYLQF